MSNSAPVDAGISAKDQPSDCPRIFLSPPHMSGEELGLLRDAFESNWIAPLGPNVDAFEQEFAEAVGASSAVALASGTAAVHLGLILAGVKTGDDVFVSSFTFVAAVNPIRYLGATPVFIDSERLSWNLDPALLEETLQARARNGRLPKALVLVHLYGQSADIAAVKAACDRFDVVLIEDAAEALGSSYRGVSPGTIGQTGAFSFNGNKIITTSGGGMLVTNDGDLARHARKLASQARDLKPHYEHTEIGYNYRLSNLLAAIGRGQLAVLENRVLARRRNFESYREALEDLPGITFQPESSWGRHSRWLTCILLDPEEFGADREDVRLALERENIESRPFWKPMHLQPVFKGCQVIGGAVSESLFRQGLCLPSGSQLTRDQLERVAGVVRSLHRAV